MSLTLHLGVIDVPYPDSPDGITTGDVAEILEAKYGVIGSWWDHHQNEVVSSMEEGMANSLESLLMGAPPTLDPFGSAMSKSEQLFRTSIDQSEFDSYGIPGVPTQAALKGVNHRFKKPYAKRPKRPSFLDTGLYQTSYKMWVD